MRKRITWLACATLLCALLKLPLVPCEGVEKLRALGAEIRREKI